MAAHADFVCFRCENAEAGTGGPFRDLQLAPKPKCPRCGARRWMQQQFSGYTPLVSGTKLTPTHLGSDTTGAATIAATEVMGAEHDRQQNIRAMTRHAQIHNPWAPKLVGANGLASAVQGVPLTMPGPAGDSRPVSRPVVLADGMPGPRRIAPTQIIAKHVGTGTDG